MNLSRLILSLLYLLTASPVLASDILATSQQEVVKMTLVTEHSGIVAGKPIQAGILIETKEGWHTYWENPGDAGMPTQLKWTLPQGFTAGAIDWPAPQLLREGTLATYSYVGRVFLPVTITPPTSLEATATYPLKVKVETLVCKDICIPESAELQVTLPATAVDAPITAEAGLFERHRKHSPQPLGSVGQLSINGNQLTLSVPIEAVSTRNIQSAVFFLREPNVINYAAPQNLTIDKSMLNLSMELVDSKPEDTLSGILVLTSQSGSQDSYNITFTPASASVAVVQPPTAKPVWFPVVLLLAIMGGLVLNLMPCVLPILSLKALAIAKKAGGKHDHVVRLGVAYTLGILLSFGVIAGLLLALRDAGESIGWGYQMQSPAFVGFLIYLLFMVGLNLSGLFHLPVLLGSVGGEIANESSARGSFFTGVLATAVATPCTAPFMASAVGAALTMPALQALLVFEALGFGLALPFLLISIFPRLRSFLPKPGAWMDHFKQLLAFPMYASVIWLMWVLALQTGAGGMVVALSGMLAIIFIIWLKSWFADGSTAYRIIAIAVYALIIALSLPSLDRMEISTATPEKSMMQGANTIDYSKEKLAELRKAGKPVFIDATAAWCITCQVNARVALHTDRTMAEFKKRGITLMIADWTRRNDDITEFLSGFGYSGVPLCVFYPAGGGKPVVLPQILTEDIVLTTINNKGN